MEGELIICGIDNTDVALEYASEVRRAVKMPVFSDGRGNPRIHRLAVPNVNHSPAMLLSAPGGE